MNDDAAAERASRTTLASEARGKADVEIVVMELYKMMQSMLFKDATQKDNWKRFVKQLRKNVNTKPVPSHLDTPKRGGRGLGKQSGS